jgi:hypothetical protein
MSWTKRQLVDEALAGIGVASYDFDITPEERQRALRLMDSMLATWEKKGARLGYTFPSSPDDSDLDDDSGLPDSANETVYSNLSIRLAPGYGKQIAPATARIARDGYDALLWAAAYPTQQQMPNTMPRGAGNKPWRTANQPFFPTPDTNPLRISQGGDLDILPE